MKYTVKIEKLDHQGRGIAFTDGIITFIPNTLVDELVEIEIVKNKRKIREGKVVRLLEQSPKRITPVCPDYNSCGGCHMMHLTYQEELAFKENKVKEIIARFTDISPNLVKKIVASEELNYRNKATFQVKEKIGYYQQKSYEIIPIEYCYIVDEKINDILKLIRKMSLENVYQIVIRTSDEESMVVFKLSDKTKIDIELLKGKVSTIISFYQEYKVLYGNGYIVDKISKYSFFISPDSFFQVNTKGAHKIYQKVLEYVQKSDYLLDLYCGTGTIGIYLSEVANKVLGIEINQQAVKDANKNKELNRRKNIEFICQSASLLNEIEDFDTVVVDPPRSGLDKQTKEYLMKLQAEKIVYVSCDPMTLARDLNDLKEFYDVKEITPVDMFSKTHHVETVTLMTYCGSNKKDNNNHSCTCF